MRILTVHGSPDREGNSAKLLAACIEGMRTVKGVEVESVHVDDFRIEPVWKDYFGDVMKKTTDRVGDEMPKLKAKMRSADVILLASPIHWGQLTGKMKVLVDRWSDFIEPDFSTGLKGKGLALLSTHSGIGMQNSSNILQIAMYAAAQFLGMVWMGAVAGRARMPWEWDDEASLEEARRFGAKLARGVSLIGQPLLARPGA
jgi:multimeric flavodoxin WrbA